MAPVDLLVEPVRAARALLKWTQEELASRAGVAVATVSFWETERVKPSEETKILVLQAFEQAGIEFYNGGQPGVRLMRNRET